MFGFSLGGSSSKQKSHSWIDPETRALQGQNYSGILGTPGYQATSADQIQSYMNPYTQNVVDKSVEAFGRGLGLISNFVGDQATRAHAFGGSRHGVAEGAALAEGANNLGLLTANLYNQGYGQALDAARNENQFGYQGLLSKLGLGNQALGLITPETFSKGKGSTFGGGVSGQWGK